MPLKKEHLSSICAFELVFMKVKEKDRSKMMCVYLFCTILITEI